MDITRWLEGLGLERYQPAFRESDIDTTELTGADLPTPRMTSIGYRKLVGAIVGLRSTTQSAPV